ncbi:hypothetical protein [Persicobacter diffluens]|uniref:hypothetical protein n=1 Tax=Persicobacter diffluens TaxID=981 RepID=UPI0030C75EEB
MSLQLPLNEGGSGSFTLVLPEELEEELQIDFEKISSLNSWTVMDSEERVIEGKWYRFEDRVGKTIYFKD